MERVSKEAIGFLVRVGPLPGSLWVHAEGGTYTVVCTAIREADLMPVVVYRDGEGVTWVRPLTEFAERFKSAVPGGGGAL